MGSLSGVRRRCDERSESYRGSIQERSLSQLTVSHLALGMEVQTPNTVQRGRTEDGQDSTKVFVLKNIHRVGQGLREGCGPRVSEVKVVCHKSKCRHCN